jgi:Mor family transcriptional regulator
MVNMSRNKAVPTQGHQLGPIFADPDLVDRIFEYIATEFPEMTGALQERATEIKAAIRDEFGGEKGYVAKRSRLERQHLASAVLELFNGRNASEVARRLEISRATVYRLIKQPGP